MAIGDSASMPPHLICKYVKFKAVYFLSLLTSRLALSFLDALASLKTKLDIKSLTFSRLQDSKSIKDYIEYYRVLQSLTESDRVLQSLTESYRVLRITEYHRVLQSIKEYNRVLQSITE